MQFQGNISLVLGRMEDHRRVKFTSVELVCSAEIAAPVKKAGGSLRWRESARGRPTGRRSWHEPS
jgi:hypothetical protein